MQKVGTFLFMAKTEPSTTEGSVKKSCDLIMARGKYQLDVRDMRVFLFLLHQSHNRADAVTGMIIGYNLEPFEVEAGVRVKQSLLYAALHQVLGTDTIKPWATTYAHKGDRPLWGRDRFGSNARRIAEVQETYSDPHVLEALGDARIVPLHQVQAELDALYARGLGAIVRNMREPSMYRRYTQDGDDFRSHESAISADRYHHDVLVQPNWDLDYLRRYLVVAGEIAAETMIAHFDEEPLTLLDRENRDRMIRWPTDGVSRIEPGNQEWFAAQREEAERLLSRYPLVSGAIDVGIRQADGEWSAHIEAVTAGKPGQVDTFFIDTKAYAEKIAEHLHELEPHFAVESAMTP